jgi:hypothetical protein
MAVAGASRTAAVEDRGPRRLLATEVLIVLTVFPLPYVISALYALLYRLDTGLEARSVASYFPTDHVAGVLFSVLPRIAMLAGAALVCYLLTRSGERVDAIGLDRRALRRDLALLFPVWFAVMVVPMFVGGSVMHALGWHAFKLADPHIPFTIAVGVLSGIVAGVVEEIVVLGYLVRRLEQLGCSPAMVVFLAVLVRVSYHVYYGPGVLPIACWALATVLCYRRVRRLAPFIICHAVWDAFAVTSNAHSAAAALLFFGFSIVAAVLYRVFRSSIVSARPTVAR